LQKTSNPIANKDPGWPANNLPKSLVLGFFVTDLFVRQDVLSHAFTNSVFE